MDGKSLLLATAAGVLVIGIHTAAIGISKIPHGVKKLSHGVKAAVVKVVDHQK